MIDTLESYIHTAPVEIIDQGMDWYENAFDSCKNIGLRHGVNPVIVASVVAALSPRNRWARNLVDAENIINHVYTKSLNVPTCATYGKMVQKSILLCNPALTTSDRIKILNGRKIQSFFSNIIGFDNRVTIDTWMDQAYSGKYMSVNDRPRLNITRYKQIESDFIKLSKKYQVKAYQLQAMVWLEFQRQVKQS